MRRRERYPQAKESFEEALRLLLTVFPAPLSVLYLKGVCHHQLGNLALYRFRDSAEAEAHYSTALSDLELCEGLAEYDETVADMCRYALEDIRAYREGLSPTPSYHEERE